MRKINKKYLSTFENDLKLPTFRAATKSSNYLLESGRDMP